ncbi:MAG: hypothetical protein ABI446_02275, partial [Gemmatimonadaceae bacterium]
MAVLLVTLAIVAIVIVASTTTLNARLISQNSERSTTLYNVAQAGIEEVRNTLNTHPGDPTYFKDSGEVMVEDHVPALDANGSVIPHVYRTSWAGPSFSTSGQYGIYGTIIVKAEDDFGNAVYHRGTVFQDTFAKYAYFSNNENGIYFGGGDQIYGPVHSNDKISIAPSGVEFHNAVTTAKNIVGAASGIFDAGYTQLAPTIAMPTTKVFGQLASLAIAGKSKIDGGLTGGTGEATTRIEFVAVDLNGDGEDTSSDEGFMRVWSSNALPAGQLLKAAQYNAAAFTQFSNVDPNTNKWATEANINCGYPASASSFRLLNDIVAGDRSDSLAIAGSRCYLGGDPQLNNTAGSRGNFYASNAYGQWLPSPIAVPAKLAATGRPDAAYLWPISHTLNPEFQGVVFVNGKVIISGKVNGHLTIVSPNEITIGDDIKYANDPSLCSDYLGIISGTNVTMANNMLLSPEETSGMSNDVVMHLGSGPSVFVTASILALGSFGVQDYDKGVPSGSICEAVKAGRGCLYLTGGIIHGTRQPVGTLDATASYGVSGYIKRYTFNTCGLTQPPPYFPTTGRFAANRTFEVNPVNFDIHPYYVIKQPVSLVTFTPAPPAPPPPPPPPPAPPAPPPPP